MFYAKCNIIDLDQCDINGGPEIGNRSSLWDEEKKMHRISPVMGAGVVLSCSAVVVLGLYAGTARANLVVDPGFETPSANPTDVLLPTSQAGAAANPTYPWYDLLATPGDQAEISSDIPTFAG